MTRQLTMVEGQEKLARWLEDNIHCEADLCFDDPETGTNSEMLLPCVEAALTLLKVTMTDPAESTLRIRPQGEANSYVLLRGRTGFPAC